MNDYAGLNELTPLIIRYPFEKLIKAIINLKLHNKIPKSIGVIIAFILGIGIGFVFPGLGYFVAFILNLLFSAPVSMVLISGISMVVTMILASSLLIYINKKIFQCYNYAKYRLTNTTLLFTEHDKQSLKNILVLTDNTLTEAQLKKNIKDIELRINFLIERIRLYKMAKQSDKKNTAKYAILRLKRGELAVFLENFEDEYLRQTKIIEKFKQGNNNAAASIRAVSITNKEDSDEPPTSKIIPNQQERSGPTSPIVVSLYRSQTSDLKPDRITVSDNKLKLK